MYGRRLEQEGAAQNEGASWSFIGRNLGFMGLSQAFAGPEADLAS